MWFILVLKTFFREKVHSRKKNIGYAYAFPGNFPILFLKRRSGLTLEALVSFDSKI